jgi:hypothetical protein
MLITPKKSSNEKLLPTNPSDVAGDASLVPITKMILDRNRMLKSATISNPSLVKLDQQLNSLKGTLSFLRKKSSSDFKKFNSAHCKMKICLIVRLGRFLSSGTPI